MSKLYLRTIQDELELPIAVADSPTELRPAYQYTSLENGTIARLHENDYLKRKRGREY